ncbi:glutaredoxin family protein [Cellulomonas septica]|uniref:glutaredoxin family protein n=1 Tax=Cellulomonas septica TaxID=285080 RepID=UPI0031B58EF1
MGDVRVVLFGRAGCHLCEDARAVVADVCARAGERWVEVDVDAPGGAADGRDLVAELGELVPVVQVDGVTQGYWRIDARHLERALSRPRTTP